MDQYFNSWGNLEKLLWRDVLLVVAVLLVNHLLILAMQWKLRRIAENSPPSRRLTILRVVPIARLAIRASALVIIVPLLVEPTVSNVLGLSLGLLVALAYSLREYWSSFAAGIVTVLENTYQPGDWIEVNGTYGEVKAIAMRAVHLMTADDTEVIIPHSRFWTTSVLNFSSGNHSLMCVANFYLHPDHESTHVRERLAEVAAASPYRKAESPVSVTVAEKPWGTHYRVKAYVRESREQFRFITDLTMRGRDQLHQMKIRFAQAPYAETKDSSTSERIT